MKSYDVCIIGFGAAGMLALSLLPTLNICIIDPYFDGGDLFRKWHSVESNTKLIKVVDATGYNVAPTATASTLATATTNTAFRGVSFTPVQIALPLNFIHFKVFLLFILS
jgi:hypothetical protein